MPFQMCSIEEAFETSCTAAELQKCHSRREKIASCTTEKRKCEGKNTEECDKVIDGCKETEDKKKNDKCTDLFDGCCQDKLQSCMKNDLEGCDQRFQFCPCSYCGDKKEDRKYCWACDSQRKTLTTDILPKQTTVTPPKKEEADEKKTNWGLVAVFVGVPFFLLLAALLWKVTRKSTDDTEEKGFRETIPYVSAYEGESSSESIGDIIAQL